MHCSYSIKNQSGVALVLVLWFLVLLTIMAGSFALTMRRESGLVINAKQESVSGALADGGLYYAMMMLLQSNPEEKWRSDGTNYEISFGGGQIRVQIYDEVGKFDLNKADATVLVSVFGSAGLADEKAESLADAVLDWRDNDDLTHLHGAEEDEYRDAGRDYGPRNKPFQTVDELQLVLGVSYEIYRAVKPLVTVYTSEKGVDPMSASKEALLALPNVDEAMVENFLLARSETSGSRVLASQFQGVEGISLNAKKNKFYNIRAEARIADGPVIAVSALVENKKAKSGEPFTILQWSRFPVGQDSFFSADRPNMDSDKTN